MELSEGDCHRWKTTQFRSSAKSFNNGRLIITRYCSMNFFDLNFQMRQLRLSTGAEIDSAPTAPISEQTLLKIRSIAPNALLRDQIPHMPGCDLTSDTLPPQDLPLAS